MDVRGAFSSLSFLFDFDCLSHQFTERIYPTTVQQSRWRRLLQCATVRVVVTGTTVVVCMDSGGQPSRCSNRLEDAAAVSPPGETKYHKWLVTFQTWNTRPRIYLKLQILHTQWHYFLSQLFSLSCSLSLLRRSTISQLYTISVIILNTISTKPFLSI